MNQADATDYNTLMRWLLRLSTSTKIKAGDARDAAVRLASNAHQALRSGLDGPSVSAAWQEAPPHQANPARRHKREFRKKKPDGGGVR